MNNIRIEVTNRQIAAEAADKFYERYINQREWIKGKTITQGEFMSCLREHIQSAVREAWGEGYVAGSNYQLAVHKPAHPTKENIDQISAECLRKLQKSINVDNKLAIIKSACEKATEQDHSFMLTEVKRVADDRDYWREQAQSRAAHAGEQGAREALEYIANFAGDCFHHDEVVKRAKAALAAMSSEQEQLNHFNEEQATAPKWPSEQGANNRSLVALDLWMERNPQWSQQAPKEVWEDLVFAVAAALSQRQGQGVK